MILAGCSGPSRPFELGLKEIPSDLLLGSQTKAGPPLPAQLPPMTFFVSDLAGGPSPFRPVDDTLSPPIPEPPRPPANPCREAPPLSSARRQIALDVSQPPVPATYTYRMTGTLFDGQGNRQLPPVATRDVRNGRATPNTPGDFTFDVAVSQADRTTTTTYHVVPRTSAAVPPGLYIAKVDSGASMPFTPKPELLLLPFPANTGTTFTAAGSDGLTTLSYDGTVSQVDRVDACGEFVDAVTVVLKNGRASSGRAEAGTAVVENFEASYAIATQYGGLAVRDFFQGGSPTGFAARRLEGVISQVPKDPAG
jgi:hypothetical protein